MSAPLRTTKILAIGAILAASVGCATSTPSAPSALLKLDNAAPSQVKAAYSTWVGGGKLAKNSKEKCYGVSLKGENDCGAASGTSCKGAKSDCKAGAGSSCKGMKGAKSDCKAGAGSSCKGTKAGAKHDCKSGAGASCKGMKGAKSDCKAGAGSSCKGTKSGAKSDCKASSGITCKGNATADWQGDAWTYVPKGSCALIITPNGNGSLTPK